MGLNFGENLKKTKTLINIEGHLAEIKKTGWRKPVLESNPARKTDTE